MSQIDQSLSLRLRAAITNEYLKNLDAQRKANVKEFWDEFNKPISDDYQKLRREEATRGFWKGLDVNSRELSDGTDWLRSRRLLDAMIETLSKPPETRGPANPHQLPAVRAAREVATTGGVRP